MNKDLASSQNNKEIILNLVIVILTIIGTVIMFTSKAGDIGLQSEGVENLKFYTVLSNLLCGLVALIFLVLKLLNKDTDRLLTLKLAAVSSVSITFSVVAFFLGPLYGFLKLYRGGNFFFHLVVPVIAMIEFVIIRRPAITIRHAALAAVPTLLYGLGYIGNILINGIGGPWPDTNDIYGFLNWGYPVGVIIFLCITLLSFGIALIFRKINNRKL